MTFDEIMQNGADGSFVKNEIDTFCGEQKLTMEEFCDGISRRIARGYSSGELTYSFCDRVVNHVYSFMVTTYKRVPPPYSLRVFLAFDEGEYRHPKDKPGSSPEQLYTKPMIAKILASDSAT